jgi:hypothetical protein
LSGILASLGEDEISVGVWDGSEEGGLGKGVDLGGEGGVSLLL